MSKVTIKTIAKEANVSTATVSKALNPEGKYKISPKVKQTVLDVANKYHYSPDPSARNLRQGSSNTYVIILNEIDRYDINNLIIFSAVIKYLEKNHKMYHVLYLNTNDDIIDLLVKSKASYSICINITNDIVLKEITNLEITNFNLSTDIGIDNSCFINTNKIEEIDFLIEKNITNE